MKSSKRMLKQERKEIANEIVALGNKELGLGKKKLELGATTAGWIPIKYETGSNSVAAVVSVCDRVSFLITTSQLLDQARTEGFNPIADTRTEGRYTNKYRDRYRFHGLRISDIENHAPLFSAIIKDSVDTLISRRPKGK